MRSKSLGIVLLSLILSSLTVLFFWSLKQDHLKVAPVTFAGLYFITLISLLRLATSSSKSAYQLSKQIKNKEYMQTFSKSRMPEISESYNSILGSFSEMNLEKKSGDFYFRQLLEITGTGIISLINEKELDVFNQAAIKLLGINQAISFQDLKLKFSSFVDLFLQMENGEQDQIKLIIKDKWVTFFVFCSVFKLQEKVVKLFSFQNIQKNLENEELVAWQKLISVLRHEIMNSVAPVTSLTSVILKTVSVDDKVLEVSSLNNQSVIKIFHSIKAIDKRNQGLLKFIESYKAVTSIPLPNQTNMDVNLFFDSIASLMQDYLMEKRIHLEIRKADSNPVIGADEKQLTQVIINLIKNASEAIGERENGHIVLASHIDEGMVIISVSDNGSGIPEDISDKIFIPFFSTKTNGSGIGLSFSRQVLARHNATINCHSDKDGYTIFTIRFSV